MELLSLNTSDFSGGVRESTEKCLQKWNLLAFREDVKEASPLLLVYQANPKEISAHWYDIVADVALFIQAELEAALRRNLSLVFISTGALERQVVREIRENTYCCKKIIIEAQDGGDGFAELKRYYLGGHNVGEQNADVERKINLDDLSLSDYVFKEHPDLKEIISKPGRQ